MIHTQSGAVVALAALEPSAREGFYRLCTPIERLIYQRSVKAGKWIVPEGMPTRGWGCLDIEDAGAPSEKCQLCETEIRYVHVMSHPQWHEHIKVGCVCAGYLEQDERMARYRETEFKKRAERRKTWMKPWPHNSRRSRVEGWRVGYWPDGAGSWYGEAEFLVNEGVNTYRTEKYSTIDEVKRVLFDFIESQRPKTPTPREVTEALDRYASRLGVTEK